jgi:integrase/recombinase XerC
MVDSFIKYISFEKRYSQHTVNSYKNDLNQFSQYLSSNFQTLNLQESTQLMVRSWILSLMDSGIAPKSVNRKIASLRSYYKFLLKREAISKDPTAKVKLLKTPKPLPNFVDESEISDLLDKAEFQNDFEGQRKKLILELFYGTGIRLSELIGLLETNVDLGQKTIKVLGKRNKERIIPISESLCEVISNYKKVKKTSLENVHSSFLIVNNNGEQSYPMMIQRVVKSYLKGLKSIDKKSPHVLRHTFATHLLNKGADLNAVKDLLGHTSLAATQVYTHNSLDKLKSVFDQAHPKA